jgi:HEAT repeat protein
MGTAIRPELLEVLLERLRDGDVQVRQAAVEALGGIAFDLLD